MCDNEIMWLQYLGGMNPGETFWRQRPDLKPADDDYFEQFGYRDVRDLEEG